MKKIALVTFISMFVLLRPYLIQGGGFWYNGDDHDYFAHASSIVFGQFPSYKKENLPDNEVYPQRSIGCSLLVTPFVGAFSLLDRFEGSSIIQERTDENIKGSWSQYGFIFGSCFYFILACFLLYRGLRYHVPERYAWLSIVLMVFCQGLPLFTFRRPIFSHTEAFFLQGLFVFLLLKNNVSNRKFPYCSWHYYALGIMSALIFLTRYNNVGYALVWMLIFIYEGEGFRSFKKWGNVLITGFSFVGMIAVFKILPEIYNQHTPYQGVVKDYLTIHASLAEIGHRIGGILGGLDWGMIYTSPYVLVGLISIFLFNCPCKKYFLLLFAGLLINLYIIISWGTQGGWYGYRYFIVSAMPLLVIPLAVLLEKIENGKKLTFLWFLIAVPPVLSMICFEGNDTYLDLHLTVQAFAGHIAFTNNLYQFHVWETVLFKPLEFWGIILKGGLGYLSFLFVHFLQPFGLFKNAFIRVYSVFDPRILIKTLLIYLMPFGTWWILDRLRFFKDGGE